MFRLFNALVIVFQLNVEELSRIEGTKSEELLRILKPLIKEKCVLQELRKYPLCDSCYGYRSCTPKTGQYIKKFEKKMACFSVYSAPKTCWYVLFLENVSMFMHLDYIQNCAFQWMISL